MIKEAYVSFEVAKLLKDKGFNVPCCRRYNGDSMITQSALHSTPYYQEEKTSGYVLCPTHQMAMAWLREKHNIHIEFIIFWMLRIYYSVDIVNFQIGKEIKRIKTLPNFDSYEEAVEAAIKYCLENLI